MSSNARDTVRHTPFVRVKVWPQGVYRSDPSDLLIFWCTGFSTANITAIVGGGGASNLKKINLNYVYSLFQVGLTCSRLFY